MILLFDTVFLVENQVMLIVFVFTWSGLEPRIYCTWDKHTNHYTTEGVTGFR